MRMNIVNKTQTALQCYDKGVLTKEQVSEITGINLDNGEMEGAWTKISDTACKSQVLMQMYDKQLITDEALLKQLFNIEEKRKDEHKV